MSTWISQSTPILVCFELAFSQIYPFPKYSDITAFIHRTVMTFIAFFLQNRKGTWPLCRSCWTVAVALGHCPMETFPISGKKEEESWPTSPVLSENYDVSSIHIHKTFNTVFLMQSLSASYLVLCPLSMLPPTTRLLSSVCSTLLQGKMVLAGPGRRWGYCRYPRQRRHLLQPLCSRGFQGEGNCQELYHFLHWQLFPVPHYWK